MLFHGVLKERNNKPTIVPRNSEKQPQQPRFSSFSIVILSSICIVLLTLSLTSVTTLDQKESELKLKIDKLAQIENDKVILESQIFRLNSQLTSAKNEKSALESQVLDFDSEVAELEAEKAALQSQISDFESEITTLQNEVTQNYFSGFDDGKVEGYKIGVVEGAGSAYDIRDPTYAEAMAFVDFDQTDKNVFSLFFYDCVNFAADFNNNALKAGFRGGFVYIQFPESMHAIVCFDTLDSGLVFIEPQSDAIVTLKIGEVYWDRAVYAPDFDDTVVKYVIIW